MMIRVVAAGVMLSGMVASLGCGESPTSPSDLTGKLWRLVSIAPVSGPSTVVTDPSRYAIEFLNETRLSARADCNTCTGTYSLSGRNVTIGALACTRAFCGESSLDAVFTQGLTDAKTLTLDDQLLEIGSDARTLRFRAQ